jgi:hypothetical protein
MAKPFRGGSQRVSELFGATSRRASFSRTLEGTFPSLTNDRDLTLDARSSLGYRLCARDVHHYGPAGESLAVPKKPARPEVLRSVQQTAQFRATPSVSDQSTRSSRGRSRHEYQTAVSKTKLTASVSLQPTSTGRDRPIPLKNALLNRSIASAALQVVWPSACLPDV